MLSKKFSFRQGYRVILLGNGLDTDVARAVHECRSHGEATSDSITVTENAWETT